MGCGRSIKKDKIILEMEICGLPDVDNMFSAAVEPLKTLDKIGHKLKKHIKKLKKSTGCNIIKDSTFKDALESMLFCYSVSTDGDFNKINLEITLEKPYIKIEKGCLKPEHQHIPDAWNEMLETFEESLPKVAELQRQLHDFWSNILHLEFQAGDILKNANYFDKSKGVKCARTNAYRLSLASKVFVEFQNKIKEVSEAISHFANKCSKEELEKIESIGKAMEIDHFYEPKEIIKKFWPDPSRIDLILDKPPKKK